MIQVMEAKWREYGKAKVATDRRRKEEAAQKQMEEILQKEAEMRGSVHDNEDSEGQLRERWCVIIINIMMCTLFLELFFFSLFFSYGKMPP